MSWKHQNSDQVLDKLIRSILPNKHDQFEEGSDQDHQQNAQSQLEPSARSWAKAIGMKRRIYKRQKKSNKQRKTQSKHPVVINLQSDENQSNAQQNAIKKKQKQFQLDDQEIQYYKRKLNITPPELELQSSQISDKRKEKDSSNQDQEIQKDQDQYQVQEKQKKNQIQFIPPIEVKRAPKYIYQYPPYPLGPTDTWPPKYPNSWKSFKMEMKETRKLD